jgi:RHS repeat-associated protein
MKNQRLVHPIFRFLTYFMVANMILPPNVPLTIVAAEILDRAMVNDGHPSRSIVTNITAPFPADQRLVPSETRLQRLGQTSVMITNWNLFTSAPSNLVTLTLTNAAGKRLQDGNYLASFVTEPKSPAVSNSTRASVSIPFHQFFGDRDGDRDVDFSDEFFFRQSWLNEAPSPLFDPQFDLDGNGKVDLTEFASFTSNYFTVLPSQPAIFAYLQTDDGPSETDHVTGDPTVKGNVFLTNSASTLRAGLQLSSSVPFHAETRLPFDVSSDVEEDGSFTLSSNRLAQILGGPLEGRSYLLSLQLVETNGIPSARFEFPFSLSSTNCALQTLADWTIYVADPIKSGSAQPMRGSVELENCAVVLREGDSFLVSMEKEFVVAEGARLLAIAYDQVLFDRTQKGRMKDAFEVAILDQANHPITYTLESAGGATPAHPSRDACFNLTDGQEPLVAPGVAHVDGMIYVDLSNVPPGNFAKVLLRLINNDGDSGTQVRVTEVSFRADLPPGGHANQISTAHSELAAIARTINNPVLPSESLTPAKKALKTPRSVSTFATTTVAQFPVATNITINSNYIAEIFASNIRGVSALAFPPDGSVYGPNLYASTDPTPVASCSGLNSEIVSINPEGKVTKVATLPLESSPWFMDFPPLGSSYGDFLYVSANDWAGDPCAFFDGGGTIMRVFAEGGWTNFTGVGQGNGGPTENCGIAFGFGSPFRDNLFIANSSDPPSDITQVDLAGAVTAYFDGGGSYVPFSPLLVGKGPWSNLLLFRNNNDILGLSPNQTVTNIATQSSFSIEISTNRAFGTALYFTTGNEAGLGAIVRISPNGRKETFAEGFGRPWIGYYGVVALDSLVFSADGKVLFLSDWENNQIYRIRPRVEPATLFLSLDGAPASVSSGSQILLSGVADYTGGIEGRGKELKVNVNGTAVEALDVFGNFYSRVTVHSGANAFEIAAEDENGQRLSTVVSITGIDVIGASQFANLSVVSGSVTGDYGRTSFHEETKTLYTELALINSGSLPIGKPLLVGIARLSDPSVTVAGVAGLSPDGIPYFDFSDAVTNATLSGSQHTDFHTIAFHNPNKVQFNYELVVLGQPNEAPRFTTIPPLEAVVGKPYSYLFHVIDPDGDPVTVSPVGGPNSAVVNTELTTLAWTPNINDVGAHEIRLQAMDTFANSAEQRFVLNVLDAPSNRPPHFVSTPITVAHGTKNLLANGSFEEGDLVCENFIDEGCWRDLLVGSEELIGWQIIPSPADRNGLTTGGLEWGTANVAGPYGKRSIDLVNGGNGIDLMGLSTTVTTEVGREYELSLVVRVGGVLGISIVGVTTNYEGEFRVVEDGQWRAISAKFHADGVRTKLYLFSLERSFVYEPGGSGPSLDNVSLVPADESFSYTYRVRATDPDDDDLTYALSAAPTNMTIDSNTGLIRWFPSLGQVGEHNVVVQVEDGHGGVAYQSYGICVMPEEGNRPPVIIAEPAPWEVGQGTFSRKVYALDADGDALRYSLLDPPGGMTIDSTTGTLTWSAAGYNPSAFPVHVVVKVEDGRGGVDTKEICVPILPISGGISGQVFVGDPVTAVRIPSSHGGISSAIVFVDFNENGIRDACEPFALSDRNGNYSIGGITAGCYRLGIEPPHGWDWSYHSTNLVFNGSFERLRRPFQEDVIFEFPVRHPDWLGGVVLTNGWTSLPGWKIEKAESQVAALRNSYAKGFLPSDGDLTLVFNGRDRDPGSVLAQTLCTEPNQRYDLSFMISRDGDGLGRVGVTVSASDEEGHVLSSLRSFAEAIAWKRETMSFVAVGKTTTLVFRDSSEATVSVDYYLDDMVVTKLVPLSSYHAYVHEDSLLDTVDFNLVRSPFATNPISLAFKGSPETNATANAAYVYHAFTTALSSEELGFDLVAGPAGMLVQTNLGVVVWRPSLDQIGEHEVVLRVQGGSGAAALQSFQIKVVSPNSIPIITSLPYGPATVGLPYRYLIQAQDAENDPLNFSFGMSFASGMTLSPSSLSSNATILDWIPRISDLGTNKVQIIVRDSSGSEGKQTFDLEVIASDANHPPHFTGSPRQRTRVATPWTYVPQAVDPDGDRLDVSLAVGPVGMLATNRVQSGELPNALLLSWTPQSEGSFPVELVVSDGRPGGVVTQAFNIQVSSTLQNDAPVIVSLPPSGASTDNRYEYRAQASDPDGDAVSWRIVEGPLGMSIDAGGGTLVWNPTTDQLGTNHVSIEAKDIYGAASTQSFDIDVSCVNRSPGISSVPIVVVPAGELYLYGPRAIDPDDSQLTWSLLDTNAAPAMTINATNGLVRWRTSTNDLGAHSIQVRVSDPKGASDTQSYVLYVTNEKANHPPAFTSSPLRGATVDRTYTYSVQAIDRDGDSLSLSLAAAPPGASLQLGGQNGRAVLSWMPSAAQIGQHDFIIVAKDPTTASAFQRFTVLVRSNSPPVITSDPLRQAVPGVPYLYDVSAYDPDGDPLTFSINGTVPGGFAMDRAGRISWTPLAAQAGAHDVNVVVTDSFGASATQSFTVSVNADLQPPAIVIYPIQILYDESGNWAADVNSVFQVLISATDNVRVEKLSLQFEGKSVPLTARGVAAITAITPGIYSLVATATDAAGNVGTATQQVRVVNRNANSDLTVKIISPADNSRISKRTPIVASISSSADIFNYHVDYAAAADVDLQNISHANSNFVALTDINLPVGTKSLSNQTLALFDPTTLLNDGYLIRIAATDVNGNITYEGVIVNVEGELKFGEFRIEFTDLAVPLSGLPIQVSRVYDTRLAKRSGDFGFGWSLGVQDARIKVATASGGLQNGARVYLTAPDGRRIGFTAEIQATGGFLGIAATTYVFRPDPGVYEKLEADGLNDVYFGNTGIIEALDGPFMLQNVRLSTKEGLVYEYDQDRGLQKVTDRNGNKLVYTDSGIFHYAPGEATTDQSVQFRRDERGRIKEIIDPAGMRLVYSYDGSGDLRSFSDQSTNITRYAYDTQRAHFLTNIVDPFGKSALSLEYDQTGKLKTMRDAAGNPINQDFDSDNNIGTFTDAKGNQTIVHFDDRGKETARIIPGISTNLFAYDQNGNLTNAVNGRGYQTNFVYDARGNVTSITDALSNRTTITYNDLNKPVLVINALNQSLQLSYNSSGQLTQVVNNAGFKTRITRDDEGRVKSLTDATGTNTTTFDYAGGCACGRPGKVINPDGSFRLYEYTAQGLANRVVNELGAETLSHYDDTGKLLWVRDPLTNFTQFFYDGPLLTNIVDALGRSTRYEYDALNRTNKIIDAEGSVIQFRYDANGNRTYVIDPVANVTQFVYDAANRLRMQIDPLSRTNFFTYDPVGNRIEAIDRNGRRRTFAYDAMNRMTNELWWEGANVVRSIVFGFNELGVQVLAADPAARFDYAYDVLNRLERVAQTAVPDQLDFDLAYTYTTLGQVESVTDNYGVRVGSQYDNRNRVASRTWRGPGVDPTRVDFLYDLIGNRTRTDRYADLAGTSLIGFTTSAYNPSGGVTNIIHLGPASEVLARYDYNFDPTYQITRWTIGNQLSDFAYDRAGQLTNALNTAQPNENFHYDSNGNRVGAQSGGGYSVGRNNQILSDASNNYAYDAEGNMTSRSNVVTGVLTTFEFDHRNRLVSVLDRDNGGVVTQTVVFVYEAMNRRLSKTVNGQATRFLYNQNDSWADLDGNNAVTARYLHGASIDELLARQRVIDGRGWYLTDHLGTVRDIANATGGLAVHRDYSSFGQVLGASNPALLGRFAFTGRELDPETRLYFYRTRYYSATMGRFISEDMAGFSAGDVNLHRYANQNPGMWSDPSGTASISEYAIIAFRTGFLFGFTTRGGPTTLLGCALGGDEGRKFFGFYVFKKFLSIDGLLSLGGTELGKQASYALWGPNGFPVRFDDPAVCNRLHEFLERFWWEFFRRYSPYLVL